MVVRISKEFDMRFKDRRQHARRGLTLDKVIAEKTFDQFDSNLMTVRLSDPVSGVSVEGQTCAVRFELDQGKLLKTLNQKRRHATT